MIVWNDLFHSFPNALDLLALTTFIGTLACRLWVIRPMPAGSFDMRPLLTRLWRLLLVCLIVLAPSSAIELVQRASEMSGRPLREVSSVLRAVLFNTHYGHAWLIRIAALAMLWVGWWQGRRRLHSRAPSAFMLAGALLVGMTRSASGHGADAGDFSLPELMDWIHLLAASLWSGSLVVFVAVIFPAWPRVWMHPGKQYAEQFAGIAQRFSTLAGIALPAVLLTGLYNFWLEAGTVSTLWTTSYGNILGVKLVLVLALIGLGASNRYLHVPRLQRSADSPQTGEVVRRFARTVTVEVILMTGVLVCAAQLMHETPARHQVHAGHITVLSQPVHATH